MTPEEIINHPSVQRALKVVEGHGLCEMCLSSPAVTACGSVDGDESRAIALCGECAREDWEIIRAREHRDE